MRKFLYGLLGVVVLLVAAALIVPGLIDWNAWKGEIAAQAKAATGRDLAIDGDLDFAVLPSPRLTANGVRLKNIPGAGAPDMAVLKSLDVRIRFAPLLSGRVEVASVTLVEPMIRLEKLADGRVNWDFRPPGTKPGAKPVPSTPARSPDGGAVRLDSVRIANGTLVWRDAAAGTEERVERVNAEIAARSLSGPFQLTGGLVADGIPLDLDASVGQLKEGAALPFSLRAGVRGADAQVELSGAVNDLGATPRFSGRIEARGSSMARLVATAAPGAGPLPGFLGQPFFLQAQLTGSEAGGSAETLEVSLGDARATGNLTLTAGDRPKAALRLSGASVDLDKWLAMTPAAAPAGAGSSGGSPPPAAEAAAAPFALPGGMNATVDLRLDAATWRGGALRDIRLQAALTEGELTLSQASLRLPGEAEASLFGFLTAKDGAPSFDGTMEARADNLRGTLEWLKLGTAGVPADRLRKFALSAKLRGNAEQVQVIDAIVSLDTSRIDGGVTFALRERPAFGASITINQLNLDAYLPAVTAAPPAAADPRTATDVPTPLRQGAKPEASPRGPFAALNDFDANLRLRIGSLTWRRTGVQGVGFDGTLAHGRLEVREAAVQSLAGTSASLKGELSGFDGLPVFRGEFAADSGNLAGLLRMTGLENTLSARRLGTMRLRGKADGGAEKLTFDTTLELAGGRAALKGTMEALSATPSLNGTLTANHPELSEAVAAFGGGNAERKLGPLAASADINGGLEAMTAQGRVRAVGGELTFGGRLLNALTAPKFDAKVNAGNPEFGDLLRVLAPEYRPAAARLGAFRLEASLKGDAEKVELPAIKASVGPASVSGSGTLALTGKRPSLTAGLTGGVIDLNPFLPAEERRRAELGRSLLVPVSTAALAQAPAPAQRFSAEPLDLSALEAMDATVTLGAGALIWRNFRVDNPNAKAVLADRVVTVEQLAGRLFDGDFLMKGKLDGSKVPALDATVTVKQANVGKALFQAAEFDVAGGKMDFQTALAATGRSPLALVSALNGQGSLKVRDGVVKGFDLKAVSDRLKELDKGLDFLRLLGSSMGGGETKFAALDGTFRVEKGVLRTDDLKLVAEAGEGTAKGTASLPRWTMDFTTQFKLTEHPKAPPFGMQVQGPIDNPRRIFRFEALQTYLLQRGVGTLLRKALPQQPEQGGGEQPQEKRPPTGEELLRGIFENLRRR